MASREAVAWLRYVHGLYNLGVVALFCYQGWLGLGIRRARRAGRPDIGRVSRHRRVGPVAAVMGGAGFLAGASLAYIDYGHVLKYPIHFLNGAAIVLLISAMYLISKRIRGAEEGWRARHRAVGIVLLALYALQAFLGLGILL